MGMRSNMDRQQGFALVEVLVAVVLCTVGALALASVFVGASAMNRRVAQRQKAMEYATQQIERLKSLAYSDVAMPTDNNTDIDWLKYYCPISSCSAADNRMITNTSLNYDPIKQSSPLLRDDPRELKVSAQPVSCASTTTANRYSCLQRFPVQCTTTGATTDLAKLGQCPRVARQGVILYTYVYWGTSAGSPTANSKIYKMATVVARYTDPPIPTDTSKALSVDEVKRYTSVSATAIIADIPQLGQVQ